MSAQSPGDRPAKPARQPVQSIVIPTPPGGFPDPAAVDGDLVDELDANLQGAHHSLQELLRLLAGCRPAAPLKAHGMRGLLLPIADQVEQAAQAAQLLAGTDG